MTELNAAYVCCCCALRSLLTLRHLAHHVASARPGHHWVIRDMCPSLMISSKSSSSISPLVYWILHNISYNLRDMAASVGCQSTQPIQHAQHLKHGVDRTLSWRRPHSACNRAGHP